MRKSTESCIFCAPDPCTCVSNTSKKKANKRATVVGNSPQRPDAAVHEGDIGTTAGVGPALHVDELPGISPSQRDSSQEEAATSSKRPGLTGARLGSFAGPSVVRSTGTQRTQQRVTSADNESVPTGPGVHPPVPDRGSGTLPWMQSVGQSRRPTLESLPRPVAEEDAALRRALTVLCVSGLVSSDDILKHSANLDLTESEKRSLIWRQKRAENGYRLHDAAG